MKRDDIAIDEELRDRLPALTKDEFATLKENIVADGGINQPVVVWQEESVCVDGHNRLAIYDELTAKGDKLKFPAPKELSFPDRDAAIRWIEQNARGQRSLTEKWKEILIGREQNRAKLSHAEAGAKKACIRPDTGLSGPTRETLAKKHNKAPATIERCAARARVYDVVEEEFGKDSEEARKAMTATQAIVAVIAPQLEKLEPNKIVDIIDKEKQRSSRRRSASSNGKPKKSKKKECLLDVPETAFRKHVATLKKLGRKPKDEFFTAIGEDRTQRWFKSVVDELHYMHIEEHEDGTCELVVNDKERDLCTAIHSLLDHILSKYQGKNKFTFDYGRFRILLQKLLDLVQKASMHK